MLLLPMCDCLCHLQCVVGSAQLQAVAVSGPQRQQEGQRAGMAAPNQISHSMGIHHHPVYVDTQPASQLKHYLHDAI